MVPMLKAATTCLDGRFLPIGGYSHSVAGDTIPIAMVDDIQGFAGRTK